MIRYFKSLKCRREGHVWSEFQPDESVTARKLAGWDRFTSTCFDCGAKHSIERHWTDEDLPVPPAPKGRDLHG